MAEKSISKICEAMGKHTRKVKLHSLERLRDRIWEASHLIMCPYDEFDSIRKKMDETLKSIDKEIDRLKTEHVQ